MLIFDNYQSSDLGGHALDEGLTAVLDVGKTLTKLSLWTPGGEVVARETRANSRLEARSYAALDAWGIESWARLVLTDFAQRGPVNAIIPVAHGAAFAVLCDGRLAFPPPDYEEPVPEALRARYDADRDAFELTGSPRLPLGLNLGVQVAWMETLYPELFGKNITIVTWAQYWAWVFSGAAATEVTSLGCHSDLWRPVDGSFSNLARRRDWVRRLAPLRRADEVLGTLRPEWSAQTGLPPSTKVYCGIHDSNAALLAARGFPQIASQEATVLSTGTWFVAMRSPAPDAKVDISALAEARDCLVNVDAYGAPIPSARFMGGREIEILSGIDTRRVDIKPDQPELLNAVSAVVADRSRVLPSFTPGVGSFPHGSGRWIDMPVDSFARRAAVCLYVAMMADTSLDLVGARDAIVVEGRFAEAQVFTRALASLRPKDRVYISNAHQDVSYGALRLLAPKLAPQSTLEPVAPLTEDLGAYADLWRRDVARIEAAA